MTDIVKQFESLKDGMEPVEAPGKNIPARSVKRRKIKFNLTESLIRDLNKFINNQDDIIRDQFIEDAIREKLDKCN